jgi:hypothetical protein
VAKTPEPKSKWDVIPGHLEIAKELQHSQGRRDLSAGDDNALSYNAYLLKKSEEENHGKD